MIPEAALRVEEEAWNAYPYTKTRYKVPFMEKFSLEIETMYIDDAGEQENVFDMSTSDLGTRVVGEFSFLRFCCGLSYDALFETCCLL